MRKALTLSTAEFSALSVFTIGVLSGPLVYLLLFGSQSPVFAATANAMNLPSLDSAYLLTLTIALGLASLMPGFQSWLEVSWVERFLIAQHRAHDVNGDRRFTTKVAQRLRLFAEAHFSLALAIVRLCFSVIAGIVFGVPAMKVALIVVGSAGLMLAILRHAETGAQHKKNRRDKPLVRQKKIDADPIDLSFLELIRFKKTLRFRELAMLAGPVSAALLVGVLTGSLSQLETLIFNSAIGAMAFQSGATVAKSVVNHLHHRLILEDLLFEGRTR